MKDNEKISSPNENSLDSVFLPPMLDNRIVLTTSGPVREALERQIEIQNRDREVVFERRHLGRWVYTDH